MSAVFQLRHISDDNWKENKMHILTEDNQIINTVIYSNIRVHRNNVVASFPDLGLGAQKIIIARCNDKSEAEKVILDIFESLFHEEKTWNAKDRKNRI